MRSIAREVMMPRTVSPRRGRFAQKRPAGLNDKPMPGPTPKYTAETKGRILALLEQPAAQGLCNAERR
jgi:hypothetical protein